MKVSARVTVVVMALAGTAVGCGGASAALPTVAADQTLVAPVRSTTPALTQAEPGPPAGTPPGVGGTGPSPSPAPSPDPAPASAVPSPASSASPAPSSQGAPGQAAADGCDAPTAPGDIVWIDTPVITHDKDFHDLGPWVNPAVPTDWTAPVDYAGGEIIFCIQLVSVAVPSTVPIYYLVGWGRGDGADGYIRAGARFDQPTGVAVVRAPVATMQRVEGGYDAGDVGGGWNWTRAFATPNGDTWGNGAPYPLSVRVRVTLHPRTT